MPDNNKTNYDILIDLKSRVERLERSAMQRLFHETTQQINRREAAAAAERPRWERGPYESPESYGARVGNELRQMTGEKEQLEMDLRRVRSQLAIARDALNAPGMGD